MFGFGAQQPQQQQQPSMFGGGLAQPQQQQQGFGAAPTTGMVYVETNRSMRETAYLAARSLISPLS
jgi:hypothetical protein